MLNGDMLAVQLQEHYCIALGINDRDGLFADFGFQGT